jgi:hypothetical protein
MGLLVRDLNFWGPGSQWEAKTCHLGIGFGLRILADQAFGFVFRPFCTTLMVLNCFRIVDGSIQNCGWEQHYSVVLRHIMVHYRYGLECICFGKARESLYKELKRGMIIS